MEENLEVRQPALSKPPKLKKKRSNTVAALMAIGTVFGGLAMFVFLIGLVAVPRYKSFNTRAYQSEAKVALSALYVGEKAFQSEWGHYTTDIHSLGYEPSANTNYKFGFASPSTIVGEALAKQTAAMKYDANRMTSDDLNPAYGHRAPASSFADLVKKHCPDCTAGKDGFKIIAISNLDDDETLDIWMIDQDKTLKNISNDIEN